MSDLEKRFYFKESLRNIILHVVLFFGFVTIVCALRLYTELVLQNKGLQFVMSWYTLIFHLKKIKRLFKKSSGILRITMLNQNFKKQNICALVFLNPHEPHLMANTNCTASESQFFVYI